MCRKKRFYPESKFGGFTDVDGTITFFNRINALLEPSFVVCDVGCGWGQYVDDPVPFRKNLRILKGKVSKVIGIDIDHSAQSNPFIDEYRAINGESWPLEDSSVDLILCDNVLEHVAKPNMFFSEARRILRNGGYFCIRTPNRWNYIALASKLIPNRHHFSVVRAIQNKRKEEDCYLTLYKCNSIRTIKKVMKRMGFDCVVYGYEAEPAYLSFSRIFYALGVAYQRFSPACFRSTIFAFGQVKKK